MATKKPRLSITMACHEEAVKVWFTIQIARIFHPASEVQFVVVDNSPQTRNGTETKKYVENWAKWGNAGVKYIPFTDHKGTSAPRDLAIRSADADYVLNIDPHIILMPGCLEAAMRYNVENPGHHNLVSGPIVYDNLTGFSTHFDDVWRGEMRGVWASAFACPCYNPTTIRKSDEQPPSLMFSISQPTSPDEMKQGPKFRALCLGEVPVSFCPRCRKKLPTTTYQFINKELKEQGYKQLGGNPFDPAFEVPGQGLGLFMVHRESWLGFNPDFRGFGGEELYIHEKYVREGRQVLCHPGMKWNHCFLRPEGVTYPLTLENKLRNYIIGHQELGLDLAPVHKHFVEETKKDGTPRISEEYYQALVKDPNAMLNKDIGAIPQMSVMPAGVLELPQPPAEADTIEQIFEWTSGQERDLDKHLPKLRELATGCQTVVEFSKRRESLVAWAASGAKRVVSYNLERDPLVDRVAELCSNVQVSPRTSDMVPQIEECELLFIDSTHTEDVLTKELNKYHTKVNHYIVLHDTAIYGERGEDGQAGGLRLAMRKFMRANPEWSVVYHTQDQYGLTVLSKCIGDKPKLPSMLKMAGNFAQSLAGFVSTGGALVDKPTYETRLLACSDCDMRVDNRCTICGCWLDKKAQVLNDTCPLGKWPYGNVPNAEASEA